MEHCKGDCAEGVQLKNIVFGPGILCVYAHAGVIDALVDVDRSDVEAVSGSSAGAIAALIFCLHRVRPFRIAQILEANLHDVVDAADAVNLFKRFSLIPASRWTSFLENVMEKAGFDVSLTFEDLRRESGVELHVSSFDLNSRKFVYFSSESHPKVRCIDAVAASTSIPLIFENRTDILTDARLCDAAVLERYPLLPFVDDLESTLIVELDREKPKKKPTSFPASVWELVEVGSPVEDAAVVARIARRIILTPPVSVSNYRMSLDEKRILYDYGYQATLSAFREG